MSFCDVRPFSFSCPFLAIRQSQSAGTATCRCASSGHGKWPCAMSAMGRRWELNGSWRVSLQLKQFAAYAPLPCVFCVFVRMRFSKREVFQMLYSVFVHMKAVSHWSSCVLPSWRIWWWGSESYSERHRGELSGADGPLDCAGHHRWESGEGRPGALWNHQQLLLHWRCEFLRNISHRRKCFNHSDLCLDHLDYCVVLTGCLHCSPVSHNEGETSPEIQ